LLCTFIIDKYYMHICSIDFVHTLRYEMQVNKLNNNNNNRLVIHQRRALVLNVVEEREEIIIMVCLLKCLFVSTRFSLCIQLN
jgi:hypothetical protein